MADEAVQEKSKPNDTPKTKTGRIKRLLKKLGSRQALIIFLALSLSVHGLGYIYYVRLQQVVYQSPEVSLGTFEFKAHAGSSPAVSRAKFNLHVALLTEISNKARLRLSSRQFKVQQDIEQLLRQAQGGDFEDPELADLKRQLQEQINMTLDMRAVSEVIVTDLAVERPERNDDDGAKEVPATAVTSPWKEAPEG